jgi:type II secretory pathway component GspD/PulD (secretin)
MSVTTRKYIVSLALGVISVTALTLKADAPTPPSAPLGSEIRTQLNVDVNKKTDLVHLISTNNDPDIVTKMYILKHADPYELRPYLETAAGASRIDGAPVFVSCVKFKDGTGAVLVSAEDYKFSKKDLVAHGVAKDDSMSIDDIVRMLDQPKITSSSGHVKFMYCPRYRSAQDVATMIQNVGLLHPNDVNELMFGPEGLVIDPGLNAIIFTTVPANVVNVMDRLEIYDTPMPEVKVSVKVYELNYENNGKIGVDFQSWKNGPGSGLFSVSSRFGRGMNPMGFVNGTKWNATKFIQFSPRWNSRFLDFLESKSRAKAVVEGSLNIRNNTPGYLRNSTAIPSFTDGTPIANASLFDYDEIMGEWYPWGATPVADVGNAQMTLAAFDATGNLITLANAMIPGAIRITRVNNTSDSRSIYTLQVIQGGVSFMKVTPNGNNNLGPRVDSCYNLIVMTDSGGADGAFTGWARYNMNWRTDKSLNVQRNFQRDTQFTSYGFEMSIIPSIADNATTLAINMVNVSLLGFPENASGTPARPRTMRSEVNTTVMVDNKVNSFVIGGVEKVVTTRSVSKVPWLGSIPLVGYLFASESEVTRRSPLVAVVQCRHQTPEQSMGSHEVITIDSVKESLKGVEKGVTYGYDQFYLDKKKRHIQRLP